MKQKPKESLKNDTASSRPPRRKWGRRIWRGIVILCLLPFLVFGLIQIPFIQNKLVNFFTHKVSKATNSTFEIDYVNLSITKGLVLENFLLISPEQDTIFEGEKLGVSLRNNLTTLFRNRLDLDGLILENTRVNISRDQSELEFNIERFLEYFEGEDKKKERKKKPKPFHIDLGKINLSNVSFTLSDNLNGQYIAAEIPSGAVDVGLLAIERNRIEIVSIDFENPTIVIERSEKGEIAAWREIKEKTNQELGVAEPDTSFFALEKLNIRGGRFSYIDHRKEITTERDRINYNDFQISDIQTVIKDFKFIHGDSVQMELEGFSFRDKNDFELKKFRSEEFLLHPKGISLSNYEIETERSNLISNISLKYRQLEDFRNFEDKVIILADFESSSVAYSDLLYFIPRLNDSPIFRKNARQIAKIEGNYKGRLNNISGRNIKIRPIEGTLFEGAFTSRNLTDFDEALLNLSVKRIETDFDRLEALIPGFSVPSNFKKLGNLSFKGRFDGFLVDFVALGELQTDLGDINLDMRLDLKKGRDQAEYSGAIALTDFDLETWTGQSDFGNLSLAARVRDGKGLVGDLAYANMDAQISQFQFRDYSYSNVNFDGLLDKSKFLGVLKVKDPNIDFVFDGGAQWIDNRAILDFKTEVKKVDLLALNLSKEPITFKGKIKVNAEGASIEDVRGESELTEIEIYKDSLIYDLDSIKIESYLVDGRNRKASIYSDILDLSIKGQFNLESLTNDFKRVLKENYPYYAGGLTVKDKDANVQSLAYQLSIKKSSNFFELLGVGDLGLKTFSLNGILDNVENSITAYGYLDRFNLDNHDLRNATFTLESMDGVGSMFVNLDTSKIAGIVFDPVKLNAKMLLDTAQFTIGTTNLLTNFRTLNISGKLAPHPRGYSLSLDGNDWKMLGQQWQFSEKNKAVFGSDYLRLENMQLSDGFRIISLRDIDNKGVYASLNNFNFDVISKLIGYDKMDFGGEGDLDIRVANIFDIDNFNVEASVPSFTINQDPFGRLKLLFKKTRISPYVVDVSLGKGPFQIGLNGVYDDISDQIDATLTGQKVPFNILEYIITSGISETQGFADLDIVISGSSKKTKFNGTGFLKNAGSRIDYTGVFYRFGDEEIKLSDRMIDLSGVSLIDPEGNRGRVSGGIRHRMLRGFALDVDISSQNCMILNTTRADNPDYYGIGKGAVNVSFDGPFHAIDMKIRAQTGIGTQLFIPTDSRISGYDRSFVTFVDKESWIAGTGSEKENFKVEGLNLDMDLTLTDDAEVSLIFNEQLNDVIKGRGNGNLQIETNRAGEFNIFGDYEIERGEYLFTAYGIVAKPFQIKRGGRINWTGDPVNADLDIKAKYENVRAPLSLFLAEYNIPPQTELEIEASRNTDVDLTLHLTGALYSPEVNFDLSFPSLDVGQLKSLADSKLRTLRANPAQLNNQVAGLIILKTFLPSNNPLGDGFFTANTLLSSGNSTLSEFISTQLSDLLSGFVNAALPENKIVSSLDLELGLNNNIDFETAENVSLFDIFDPDEIQLKLNPRFKFLGERLSARIGGDYVRASGSPFIAENAFIPDLIVDYDITADRKLKLRFQYRYDFDVLDNSQRKQKYSVGLNYGHEFGKLVDFELGLVRALEENEE